MVEAFKNPKTIPNFKNQKQFKKPEKVPQQKYQFLIIIIMF